MDNAFLNIQELLKKRAELNSKLKLIPYEGSIEIKDRNNEKYIYTRKKVLGKNTSTYIGPYDDNLFAAISKLLIEAKELKKQIRKINVELSKLGYSETELTSRVLLNIDFARANMKSNIYDQAILEGIATTYPDIETIIENGKVSDMKPTDIQKILNLKHAWEFILDQDVVSSPTNYYILCYIAKLVNEGFFIYGGSIRSVPVSISGTSYIPPLPIECDVKDKINEIISCDDDVIFKAINLCLYCMKAQIFLDGNKRTSIIFANHYLIQNGEGLLIIPNNKVSKFKKLLVSYYEGNDNSEIIEFMKNECWRQF